MKYRVCSKEKDISSIMWNVFASFGYKDAILCDTQLGADKQIQRLAIDKGLECTIVLLGCANDKAMAEIAAVAVEASLAVGFEEFRMEIACPQKVGEILYLYSLDEYAVITEGEFDIKGYNGAECIFHGFSNAEGLVCDFDVKAAALTLDEIAPSVPETLIYTELDADGIGYEIAYTMRLSGCLVTTYLGNGTIEDCEAYAKENNIGSIIRVFADGKIQIKELGKDSITETDYNTFVGYYEEDATHDHTCECGHEHDHDHGCDCGCH